MVESVIVVLSVSTSVVDELTVLVRVLYIVAVTVVICRGIVRQAQALDRADEEYVESLSVSGVVARFTLKLTPVVVVVVA